MSELVLHADSFWISPYVFTCYVSLREKGVPFEVARVALEERAQDAPSYRRSSITGRVPSLRHGDFWLAESSAIVEYLEELYPAPTYARLLPEAREARARARQIQAWIRSDLLPIREERPTTTMFYERATRPLSAAGQRAEARLLEVADALIPDDAGPLFGAWSIADSDLAFMLQRLVMNGHDVPAKVRAFAVREFERPSIRAFVERERPAYVPYG